MDAQDPRSQGRAAWLAGQARSSNPHPADSDERSLWQFGWDDAEDEEQSDGSVI